MLLTTNEAAISLGCSAENVRILERNGKLPAERTRNGRRIFKSEDVERLAIERAQAKTQKKQAA